MERRQLALVALQLADLLRVPLQRRGAAELDLGFRLLDVCSLDRLPHRNAFLHAR
jgi:hypothetical protein